MIGQSKLTKKEKAHLRKMKVVTIADLSTCLSVQAQSGGLRCPDCERIAKKIGALS